MIKFILCFSLLAIPASRADVWDDRLTELHLALTSESAFTTDDWDTPISAVIKNFCAIRNLQLGTNPLGEPEVAAITRYLEREVPILLQQKPAMPEILNLVSQLEEIGNNRHLLPRSPWIEFERQRQALMDVFRSRLSQFSGLPDREKLILLVQMKELLVQRGSLDKNLGQWVEASLEALSKMPWLITMAKASSPRCVKWISRHAKVDPSLRAQ